MYTKEERRHICRYVRSQLPTFQKYHTLRVLRNGIWLLAVGVLVIFAPELLKAIIYLGPGPEEALVALTGFRSIPVTGNT